MRRFLNYLFFGHYFISLCAGAAFVSQIIILNSEFELNQNNLVIGAIITILTFLGYNFQRILSLNKNAISPLSQREEWFRTNYKLQLGACFMALVAFAALLFFLNSPDQLLLPLLISGGITFLYRLSFKSFNGLRNIPFLKLFLIGISWVLSCALIPCFMYDIDFFSTCVLALRFFLFIVIVTLPFDIRDYHYDTILTIPGKIGINATKWLCAVLYFLMLLTDILFYVTGNSSALWLDLILLIPIMVLVFRSKPENSEYYYLGAVDGLILLQTIALMFLNEYAYDVVFLQ